MSDPTIWDGWAPPTTTNEYSREAAESMIGRAGTIRFKTARFIRWQGPLAEYEIELSLRLRGNTVRPRLKELMNAGIITLDPEPGITPSGRRCGRYVITEFGRKLLAL
jgi:hypothetical protein